MRGRAMKEKLAALMHQHRMRPIERAALPLLAPTAGPQIIEGIAASADVDAEKMSFLAGSLIWPDDLSKLPLLTRHDSSRPAGKILSLHYDRRGSLQIRALAEDPEARRMAAFSIAATVIEAELRSEDSPSGFHFVIHRATIDEISLTPQPSNASALVTSRRDVTSFDNTSDAVQAAVIRAQRAIEMLHQSWSVPAMPAAPRLATHAIRPAPALILGNVPRALLTRPKSSFTALVAQLPPGGD
jgi:hypothetical protein